MLPAPNARRADDEALDRTVADPVDRTVSEGADGRVTVTGPPEAGDGESIAVTLEHPGRYTGPRRNGRPSDEPIELGRGGIGRVLIAHDVHLGREVAVKELLIDDGPAGRASGSKPKSNPRESLAAARFLREARLTGQLEHPNIVPVYELGTRADGTLYYTMKVVRGRNLASALEAARPAGIRGRLKLLNHYADLCDAIAYAHSRGVIHRDIKPENVMVGEFGETVVLDWGLAKPKHAKDLRGDEAAVNEAGSEGPTRPDGGPSQSAPTEPGEGGLAKTDDGTLLGTPIYMSPEQAQGDLAAVDERTDVWALGVVLYEILTGEVPFWGKTAVELLVKVVAGTFDKVNVRCPEAPPELAAIAEKALSRNPAYRYPDARAMAEEVRAWLTGGRVQAYNYRVWTLVKRWAGRHKGALIAAGLGVVALIVTGIVSYAEIADERDRAMEAEAAAVTAMNDAKAARTRAEAAEAEARRSRDSAETLVRYMLSDLKDRLEPLGQLALLEGVAQAIDQHYEDTGGAMAMEDPARVRNRAAVIALMGDLARARGDLAAAAAAYDKAEALRSALVARADSGEYRADRAESHRQRGLLDRIQGDLGGARAELGRARQMRAALFSEAPESLPYRRALVQSELDRGELATLSADLREAEAAFLSAVELARGWVKLATEPAQSERARFELSVALDGLGTARLDMHRIDDAKAAFDEALALRKELLEKRPSNLDWRHRMAVSHARLGEIAELLDRPKDALESWQRAAKMMERLVRQDPDNLRWARDLAVDWNRLGDLLLVSGDRDGAREAFDKGLVQLQALAAKDPSNAELQRDVEVGENRVADAALSSGHIDEALTRYQRALAIAEVLAARDADNAQWQHDLAHGSARMALARAILDIEGAANGARPYALRAVALLEVLIGKDPDNAGWREDLAAARLLLTRIDQKGPFDDLGPQAGSSDRRQGQRPEERKTLGPTQDQRPASGPQPQRPAASGDGLAKQPVRPASPAPAAEPPKEPAPPPKPAPPGE